MHDHRRGRLGEGSASLSLESELSLSLPLLLPLSSLLLPLLPLPEVELPVLDPEDPVEVAVDTAGDGGAATAALAISATLGSPLGALTLRDAGKGLSRDRARCCGTSETAR